MKDKIGEGLPAGAIEVSKRLRKVYEAGRAKGREEAKRELKGLVEPSAAPAIPSRSNGN